MKRRDSVEEGAAWDEKGLDNLGPEICQSMPCLESDGGLSHTLIVSPRLATQIEPKAISITLKIRMTTTTTGA